MASSSNALWIGGIVIVAALTVVELTSTRNDNATTASTDNGTIAGSVAPVSPQQDTGQIAMGTTEPVETDEIMDSGSEFEFEDMTASVTEFDAESEFSSDLIIDLDNPEADVAALTHDLENLQDDVEINVAEADSALNRTDETQQSITAGLVDDITDAAITESTEAEVTQSAEQGIAAPQDVSHHLAAAEEALKALRMTTPAGDNAYEHYQAVLAIDPNNADAHAGIQKMVDMYVYFIEKAIADDQLNTARIYLQRAEDIQPGATKLQHLRAELY